MARKKVKRPWLDYLVYLLVRGLVQTVQLMPIRASYGLAHVLGWILYTVDKRHRVVGLENLRTAYGDAMTEAERDDTVRGVYRHFCMMLMEIFHTPKKIRLENYRQYIQLAGHAPVLDRLISREPVILLTGHYGNWEIAGYLFGLFGFSTWAVARTLDNPYLERYLRTFREATGQKMIPKSGGYDQIVEVLESNRPLSMLADQDAGQRGMFVDFFGRPASTHKAIALLAIEHQAPVVVGVARRIGPGFRYELRCAQIIEPGEFTGGADDVRLLTQRYTSALEELIRQDPTQYLWLHRRWKHQPMPRKKGARATATTSTNAEVAAG